MLAQHRPFHKTPNLAINPAGLTKIIEFQGDFEDDESLVLTETCYFKRIISESRVDNC
jgi:hypothetical protein